jgi:hypothetical protein
VVVGVPQWKRAKLRTRVKKAVVQSIRGRCMRKVLRGVREFIRYPCALRTVGAYCIRPESIHGDVSRAIRAHNTRMSYHPRS